MTVLSDISTHVLQVLGHPNINITAVYLQCNDEDVQEAYANAQF